MQLLEYLARRALRGLLVLIGLSAVIFVVARVVPGDPARIALGPLATPPQVAALRHEMGFDRPVSVQYLLYMRDLLRGDLGQSLITRRSVNEDVAETLPMTLELVTASILLVLVVAVPAGAFAARRRGGLADGISRMTALIGVVTPGFLLAILLQLLAGYVLHVLPVSGRMSPSVRFDANMTGFMTIDTLLAGRPGLFLDALRHLLLPVIALSAATLGQVMRITRSSMLDVSRRDYVALVQAFGLPERLITFRYMLKQSIVPTLTILGLEFASLLGNAFVVEMVFGLPGIASYGVRAILQKDLNALMAVVILIGLVFVVVNLAVDLVVAAVDPRIRLRAATP